MFIGVQDIAFSNKKVRFYGVVNVTVLNIISLNIGDELHLTHISFDLVICLASLTFRKNSLAAFIYLDI